MNMFFVFLLTCAVSLINTCKSSWFHTFHFYVIFIEYIVVIVVRQFLLFRLLPRKLVSTRISFCRQSGCSQCIGAALKANAGITGDLASQKFSGIGLVRSGMALALLITGSLFRIEICRSRIVVSAVLERRGQRLSVCFAPDT